MFRKSFKSFFLFITHYRVSDEEKDKKTPPIIRNFCFLNTFIYIFCKENIIILYNIFILRICRLYTLYLAMSIGTPNLFIVIKLLYKNKTYASETYIKNGMRFKPLKNLNGTKSHFILKGHDR
jgi:hypothetical protein